MKKLLIVEDDSQASGELEAHFSNNLWRVRVAADIAEARKILLDEEFNPHVIIADLGLPDGNIIDHLEELGDHIENSEWMFVCDSYEDADIARISELVFDYLVRPLDAQQLLSSVNRAYRSAVTARRLIQHTKANKKRYHVDSYIGSSEPIKELKKLLTQLAAVPLKTLTITGETGTGKSVVARIIHHMGLRKDGPMVELNCAALPKELVESEIFGHEAGAFTGAQGRHKGLLEQADGGTLFLDEIGDLDLELQAKLLTAIEEQRFRRLGAEKEQLVDVQIIAATGVDIENAVAEGRFREDLYHRLSVFRVHIPPLRERKEDLVELLPSIVAEYNIKAKKNVHTIPDQVWEALLAYHWPGNVRELRNVIERCVLLATDEVFPKQWLQLESLSDGIKRGDAAQTDYFERSDEQAKKLALHGDTLTIPLDGSVALEDMDRFIIAKALELCQYNVTEAARMLNTSRETMRYRVQKYNLKKSADHVA